MQLFITLLVCIIAGACAGLTTGFAGLSAAVFITPFLVSILNVNFYVATGISLASDVLGSLVSALIFKKNKHVNVKSSLPVFIPILIGSIGGSVASYFFTVSWQLGSDIMSYFAIVGSLVIGLRFIIKPIREPSKARLDLKWRTAIAIVFGLVVGFVCGFQGAGGGVMILLALTAILKYEFKDAVGTSVLIMTFTALFGAASHCIIHTEIFSSWVILVTCIVSTGAFAAVAALIANKIKPVTLNRITGAMIIVSCIVSLVFKIVGQVS